MMALALDCLIRRRSAASTFQSLLPLSWLAPVNGRRRVSRCVKQGAFAKGRKDRGEGTGEGAHRRAPVVLRCRGKSEEVAPSKPPFCPFSSIMFRRRQVHAPFPVGCRTRYRVQTKGNKKTKPDKAKFAENDIERSAQPNKREEKGG